MYSCFTSIQAALETHFSPSRSTFDLGSTQGRPKTQTQTLLTHSNTISTTPRVTRKSQKQTADDTGDQGSPPGIDPDVPSPASPLFLPSPPPRARQASSPKDLTIRHHHQPSSSSKLPPASNEGPMDIDDDEPPSKPDEMVLDPSQTPWGRQMGISSPTRPVTPSSSKEKCSETSNDDDGGHPRKKRKSDIGPVAVSGSATLDFEATQVVSASVDSVLEPGRRPSAGPSKLTQPRLSGAATKAKNPQKKLRSQIAGFARSGSQVLPRPLSPSEDELDELDADEPLSMDEEPRDEDMIKTKTVNLRPRQSSPEAAASSTSEVVRDGASSVDLPTSALSDDYEADEDPNSVLSQALASSHEEPAITIQKNQIHRPEIIRTEKGGSDLSLRFDFEHVVSVWSKKDKRLPSLASSSTEGDVVEPEHVPSEAGVSNTENDAKAADALARVIEKRDFESMAVVGQFNLGFIVVRRERVLEDDSASAQTRRVADDLFIVDQHAADEKYNFETLQATTKIASQKLFRYFSFSFLDSKQTYGDYFRPQPLELTASDEMVALENINVLQQNGFEIDVDAEASVEQGSKLKLIAQPVSKNTTFDMKGGLSNNNPLAASCSHTTNTAYFLLFLDLEEIIHLMRDRPRGEIVRCSKARSMFAMRACRKSVMVGMPLTHHQMTTVSLSSLIIG